MRSLDKSIEELFPEGDSAMALRGLRSREGLTQKDFAEKIGIARSRVSKLETGKRPMSKEMAKRLEKVFGVSYKAFL